MTDRNETPDKRPKQSRAVEVGGHIGSLYLLENGSPRYELRIDRDGRWFHEGIEIVREDIRSYFSRYLVRSDDGGYAVRIGRDECPVVVEDVPFIVSRVTSASDGGLSLLLSDGTSERLDAETIKISESNAPYCGVRNGLEARFSRAAYYQLAEFIEYNEKTGEYRIVVNGQAITLDAP